MPADVPRVWMSRRLCLPGQQRLDLRRLRIPLRPHSPGKADAPAHRLRSIGVEIDDRCLPLDQASGRPQLIATPRMNERGQRVFFVIHAIE